MWRPLTGLLAALGACGRFDESPDANDASPKVPAADAGLLEGSTPDGGEDSEADFCVNRSRAFLCDGFDQGRHAAWSEGREAPGELRIDGAVAPAPGARAPALTAVLPAGAESPGFAQLRLVRAEALPSVRLRFALRVDVPDGAENRGSAVALAGIITEGASPLHGTQLVVRDDALVLLTRSGIAAGAELASEPWPLTYRAWLDVTIELALGTPGEVRLLVGGALAARHRFGESAGLATPSWFAFVGLDRYGPAGPRITAHYDDVLVEPL